jgi:phosphoglycerate dehydrogenase-like enzyme
MRSPPRRLLVLHSDPAEVRPVLEAGCPGVELAVAAQEEDVPVALARFRPDAVFSIKHSGFPGAAHRPALDHPGVGWFHVGGSGIDHLGRWDAGRTTVTNSAGVLAPFLAEMSIAAMFSMGVGLPAFAAAQGAGQWAPRRFRALAGRTLVVVGLGRVGAELGWRARALGLHVVGVRRQARPHPAADEVVALESLDEVLPRAEVLSLNLRLVPETVGLIGASRLGLLPPGALLLSSARGAILDEEALLSALDVGRLAGAWLDVFREEPLPPGHALWSHPRVVVTPHCGDQVEDFPARFAARFVELWQGLAAGQPLPALVPPGGG